MRRLLVDHARSANAEKRGGGIPPAELDEARRRISGFRNVWLKDLRDGREIAVTNTPAEKQQPSISPDGQRIAWSKADGNSHSVFLSRVADRSIVPLCRYCGDAQDWSPDGRNVVVVTGLDGTVKSVEASDPGQEQILLRDDRYLIDSVRYSPDGRWLAFVGRQNAEAAVFAVPLASANRGHEAFIRLSEEGAWSDTPAWSADGRRVFFRSKQDGFYCIWSAALPGRVGARAAPPRIVRHFHSYRAHLDSVPRTGFAIAVRGAQLFLTAADIRGTVWSSSIRRP